MLSVRRTARLATIVPHIALQRAALGRTAAGAGLPLHSLRPVTVHYFSTEAEKEEKKAAGAAAEEEGKKEEGQQQEQKEGAGSDGAKAKKIVGAWYKLSEYVKDVASVVFNIERKRDLETEYDSGLREYPWIEYEDPVTGMLLYKNNESGIVTDKKPLDFDSRAKPSARNVAVNTDASALTVLKEESSRWEKTLDALKKAPLINQFLAAGDAVANSAPVKKIKTKITDKVEDARETWETSQHPLIVNASYMVDKVFSETEEGRALREIQQIDSGFDLFTFIQEMQDKIIPEVSKAFFQLDWAVLNKWCQESALAQLKAVEASRAVQGNITHDGVILNVHKVELIKAQTLERDNTPAMLLSAQLQYIHCVRNAEGDIIEGSESEIRAGMLILLVTREYSAEEGRLTYRIAEMSLQGTQLFL